MAPYSPSSPCAGLVHRLTVKAYLFFRLTIFIDTCCFLCFRLLPPVWKYFLLSHTCICYCWAQQMSCQEGLTCPLNSGCSSFCTSAFLVRYKACPFVYAILFTKKYKKRLISEIKPPFHKYIALIENFAQIISHLLYFRKVSIWVRSSFDLVKLSKI